MRIAYYSNRIFFNGDFLEKQGLGGSESSVIHLTRFWKKKYPKDEVIVYNGWIKEPTTFDGVLYKSVLDFKAECRTFSLVAL